MMRSPGIRRRALRSTPVFAPSFCGVDSGTRLGSQHRVCPLRSPFYPLGSGQVLSHNAQALAGQLALLSELSLAAGARSRSGEALYDKLKARSMQFAWECFGSKVSGSDTLSRKGGLLVSGRPRPMRKAHSSEVFGTSSDVANVDYYFEVPPVRTRTSTT